jgi:hypothetical protein
VQAVFGPSDDYQVVPDETPVEALEESTDDLSISGWISLYFPANVSYFCFALFCLA